MQQIYFYVKNLNFRWKISFLIDCFFCKFFDKISDIAKKTLFLWEILFLCFNIFYFNLNAKIMFFPKCFEIIVYFRFNTWILWHGKKLLLTWTSFIDQLVHIVRVEGTGYRGWRGYLYFSQLGVSLYFSTWKLVHL